MFIKDCVWGASAFLRVSKNNNKTVRIVLSHLYIFLLLKLVHVFWVTLVHVDIPALKKTEE